MPNDRMVAGDAGSVAGVGTAALDRPGLAYRERGEGQSVVFVHGSASDLRSWERHPRDRYISPVDRLQLPLRTASDMDEPTGGLTPGRQQR